MIRLRGRHRKAVRRRDVREALSILKRLTKVADFAIGSVRRVKHGRPVGTAEVRENLPNGHVRVVVYGHNVIVSGVAGRMT